MTGRNQNKQRRTRYRAEGRESPNSKNSFNRVSTPSPTDFQSNSERSSPVLIPNNKYYSSDSEDESGVPYAGAKFNSPPPAHLLPVPPSSWLMISRSDEVALNAMTLHLRQILKVTA